MPRDGRSALAIGMTVFGLFAIVTGGADVVLGPHMLVVNDAVLELAATEPWLDSQPRFLGAMWAGWGVLMNRACRDLRARAPRSISSPPCSSWAGAGVLRPS